MTISELIKTINDTADCPDHVSQEERLELRTACERLKGSLESPLDASLRFGFAGYESMALRLGIDMKLFDAATAISADGGEIRMEELTSRMDADPLLVTRIMRILVCMNLFTEVAQGTFKLTPLAGVYVAESPLAQAVIHLTAQLECFSRLPDYFEKNGFKNPDDAYNGPLQYAMNTKLHSFELMATRPKLQHAFNTVMTIARTNRGQEWYEFFPVETKLRVQSDSHPVLIDIGGGLGHDLIAFKQKHPILPGKLIIQDLPIVIDSVKDLPSGISAMKHDFFAEQPVKDAKAYYLRAVLHDWPDKQALKILGSIREAMGSESILLVNETVMPESNVPLYSALADFAMMAGFSSMERTQVQYKALLEKAGFAVVGVWTPRNPTPGSGTLIEAVLEKV